MERAKVRSAQRGHARIQQNKLKNKKIKHKKNTNSLPRIGNILPGAPTPQALSWLYGPDAI